MVVLIALAIHHRSGGSEGQVTTQAAPARWLAQAGLPLDRAGFLRVDDTLRVAGHDDVFAAGDIIVFAPRALPKSGVYAVRVIGPKAVRDGSPVATGRQKSWFVLGVLVLWAIYVLLKVALALIFSPLAAASSAGHDGVLRRSRAPLAQLDRATDYESVGRAFESPGAHHPSMRFVGIRTLNTRMRLYRRSRARLEAPLV